ncbi:MAG: hypothetical protein KAS32_30745 [Candidatus Peribacteraceae bacterium]|nr:hypothetical protein [Candidatus Peribacteraceae bacterium]
MPTYTATCEECKIKVEYQCAVRKRDDDVPSCPNCKEPMARVFTGNAGGFILKGRGWYKKGGFV